MGPSYRNDPAADREANVATGWSIGLCVVLLVTAFVFHWPMVRAGLILVGGGLATQVASNLFMLAVIRRPGFSREAVLGLAKLGQAMVAVAMSAYVAGVILLILGGLRAGWHVIFG